MGLGHTLPPAETFGGSLLVEPEEASARSPVARLIVYCAHARPCRHCRLLQYTGVMWCTGVVQMFNAQCSAQCRAIHSAVKSNAEQMYIVLCNIVQCSVVHNR